MRLQLIHKTTCWASTTNAIVKLPSNGASYPEVTNLVSMWYYLTDVQVHDCVRTAKDTPSCDRVCKLYPFTFLHVVHQWQLSSLYTYTCTLIVCPLTQ